MKRFSTTVFLLLLLASNGAFAADARYYFDAGVKSTVTPTKIAYFTRALDLDPDLACAYEKRGMLFYFQEKYEEMIRDFHSFIELAPPNAEAYRMLGLGYLKTGAYREALRYLDIAIEMDPKMTPAYADRAQAYFKSEREEEAFSDLNTAIRLWGDERTMSDVYRLRFRILSNQGLSREAYSDLRKAWSLDPRSWWRDYFRDNPYGNLENMRLMGLIGVIVFAFVLIFKTKIRPPDKNG